MSDEPIVLLKGSDQILLADAAGAHLASMLGERDRDEVVDQFGGGSLVGGLGAGVAAGGGVTVGVCGGGVAAAVCCCFGAGAGGVA